MNPEVTVLRLGHRRVRDKRLTTHLALVARAFGATRMLIDTPDNHLQNTLTKIKKNWGGDFELEVTREWKKVVKEFEGIRVHLTMYGLNIEDIIPEIRRKSKLKKVMVIVGGKKVPAEVYHLVDYNVGVGHQPHSEVAALAIFLDRIYRGRELKMKFEGSKKSIIPQARGKKVVEVEE